MSYEVQQHTLCDGWVNTCTASGQPITERMPRNFGL